MDNIFVPIQPLYMWTQMAVPTVFTPELTNEEQLGKMLYKLNEIVGQLNNVPGLIDQKITDAFDQSGIEEEIKDILSSMQLSVKNPPEGVPAAKGDGKANDTAAINGLINYANNLATQTGIPMAVLIPTGNYAVTGLQLKDNVSLIGEDMYNTVIKVMDYTNAPAIIGSLGNAVIGNFTLNGNSANNAANFTGTEITAAGPLNMSSIRFTDFKSGDTALSLTPNAAVQISTFRAESAPIVIEEGTDIVSMEDALLINCPAPALTNNNNNTFIRVCGNKNLKELVVNNGDNSYIIAFGGAITDNSTDSRVVSDNMDKLMVGTLSLEVLGGMVLSADSVTDTVTGARNLVSGSVSDTSNGTRTIKSGNVVETVTAAKTVNAASETVTLTGKQTIKANSREVEVADVDTLQAGSLDVTVDGALETMASSQTQTVTNLLDTNYGDVSEGVAGDKIVNVGDNSTETVGKSKTIDADVLNLKGTKGVNVTGSSLKVLTTDPLTYNKPLTLNDHYNYVPMIDTEGNTYQILVFNGTDPTPEVPESHLPTYINVKELGAKGDGTTDDTAAFRSAAGFSGFIFVPAGTYLITSVTMLGGIKGIIGEMSTIKSSITSGNMLTFTAAANLAAIILDAAGAENAVSSPNGININQSILNGNVAGPINMTACSVNNNSQLSCTDNSRILGSRVNGNIALAAGVNAEITGNAISGSFVFVLSAGQKIGSLAVTGNVFNPAVTISDANITSYRAAGNVGLADYPVVEIPEPTPAFNYQIPAGVTLAFIGSDPDKPSTIANTADHLNFAPKGTLTFSMGSDTTDTNVPLHNFSLYATRPYPDGGYVTSVNPTNGNVWKIVQRTDGTLGFLEGDNGYKGNMQAVLIVDKSGNITAHNIQFNNLTTGIFNPLMHSPYAFSVNPLAYTNNVPSAGGLFLRPTDGNTWLLGQNSINQAELWFAANTTQGKQWLRALLVSQSGDFSVTGALTVNNHLKANGFISDTNRGGVWLAHNFTNEFGGYETNDGNVHYGYINKPTGVFTEVFNVDYGTKKVNFTNGITGGNGVVQQSAHLTDLTIGTSETGITLAQCGLTIAQANAGAILVNCVGATTSTGAATNISGVQLVADMETGTPTNVYSFTQTGPIFLDLRWKNWSGTGNNAFGVQGTSGGGAGKKIDLRIYYVPLS